MIQLNLRQAIVQRVQGISEAELTDVIRDSIDNEERTLPGLGVLFEIIWKHSAADAQLQMVQTLKKNLPQIPSGNG